MATRSIHLLSTAPTDQQSSVVHASTGLTIVTDGVLQVLYVDTYFRDKGQLAQALQLIAQDLRESSGDTAFTGTI